MVISAADNNNSSMATTTRTSKNQSNFPPSKTASWSRHNFTSTPTFNLTWGRQRHLRCVKDPELFLRSRSPPPSSSSSDDDDGIGAVREKLTIDFRAQIDQLKATYLAPPPPPTSTENDVATENRPWNLRTRRAVCKLPNNSNFNGNIIDRKPSSSPARNCNGNSPARNGYGEVAREEKGKRVKFAVSLSKREIEEDFLAMAGVRPARRPKKRAKSVQKQVDAMCPGFWLTEINADMYKVNEQIPDDAKRS
ncbi:uncharacterized protein LOC141598940 [Silene latifolia]|uniref:uncharacterized protein LOC141598940 n=1 Tax=Silene latifolia TaxID=37657 RepID=UPI003D77307C